MLIETTLTAATWNIWWRFGPWQERLPLIIDELRRVDPEVVALQEVWEADGTSSAAVIGDALGYQHVAISLREFEPGVRFGNAVLSRWPIVGHDHRQLPAPADGEEFRTVLRADVDGPRGRLQVYSTHLNWKPHHGAIRQEQVRSIARFVADSGPREYPAIVCGDFNAQPHSVEMGMLTGHQAVAVDGVVLRDTWREVHPTDPGFTWNTVNPFVAETLEGNARLDYVLTAWPHGPGGAGHAIASEMIGTSPTDGTYPSDHFGVASTLRY